MKKLSSLFNNKNKGEATTEEKNSSPRKEEANEEEYPEDFELQFKQFVERTYGNTNQSAVIERLMSLPKKKKMELLKLNSSYTPSTQQVAKAEEILNSMRHPSSLQGLVKTLQQIKVLCSTHATFESEFISKGGTEELIKQFIKYRNLLQSSNSDNRILHTEIINLLILIISLVCKNNEGLDKFLSFSYGIREIALGLYYELSEEARNSVYYLLTAISFYKQGVFFELVLDSMNHFSLINNEERRFFTIVKELRESTSLKSLYTIVAFINVLISQPISQKDKIDIKKDFGNLGTTREVTNIHRMVSDMIDINMNESTSKNIDDAITLKRQAEIYLSLIEEEIEVNPFESVQDFYETLEASENGKPLAKKLKAVMDVLNSLLTKSDSTENVLDDLLSVLSNDVNIAQLKDRLIIQQRKIEELQTKDINLASKWVSFFTKCSTCSDLNDITKLFKEIIGISGMESLVVKFVDNLNEVVNLKSSELSKTNSTAQSNTLTTPVSPPITVTIPSPPISVIPNIPTVDLMPSPVIPNIPLPPGTNTIPMPPVTNTSIPMPPGFGSVLSSPTQSIPKPPGNGIPSPPGNNLSIPIPPVGSISIPIPPGVNSIPSVPKVNSFPNPPIMSTSAVIQRSPLPELPSKKPSIPVKDIKWSKIENTKLEKSIWIKNNLTSKLFEIELPEKELEEIFSQKTSTTQISSVTQTKKEPEVVTLLEGNRAQNVSIFVKYIKMEPSTLVDKILNISEDINEELLSKLYSNAPNEDEIIKQKEYDGDVSKLSDADRFIRALSVIPRLSNRLECWLFKSKYNERKSSISPDIDTVVLATQQICDSNLFQEVLVVILAIGNFLNSKRGCIHGFKLSSLEKLKETKTNIPKVSALDYIVKYIRDKKPELLKFKSELSNVGAASRVDLSIIEDGCSSIEKGLTKIKQELNYLSNNPPPENDAFINVFDSFEKECMGGFENLLKEKEKMFSNLEKLAEHYGEDSKNVKKDPRELFRVISNFINDFDTSLANLMKEEEKKKKISQIPQSNNNNLTVPKVARSGSVLTSIEQSIKDGSLITQKKGMKNLNFLAELNNTLANKIK